MEGESEKAGGNRIVCIVGVEATGKTTLKNFINTGADSLSGICHECNIIGEEASGILKEVRWNELRGSI